ncbi:MAG: transcriptional regulator [Gammaproteobacteria bacterium]|nr:transcriptional regulator [Gammaproteobacteria bacterium]
MPTRPYKASNYLQSPEDRAAYLNAVLEESDFDSFVLALKNIADTQAVEAANIRPQLLKLNHLLHQAGLKLTVQVKTVHHHATP